MVKRTLAMLTDLIGTIAMEGITKSKKLLYQSLQEPISTALVIFPVYIHQPEVTDDLLSFFLALFRGQRKQMGVSFTEQTLQTFMSLFNKEQLTQIILQVRFSVISRKRRQIQILCTNHYALFIP